MTVKEDNMVNTEQNLVNDVVDNVNIVHAVQVIHVVLSETAQLHRLSKTRSG